MAKANSTRNSSSASGAVDSTGNTAAQDRIASAMSCISVLREAMEEIGSVVRADESIAGSFRRKDAIFDAVVAIAGPLSPRAAGVLGALADIAIDSIQNGYALEEQLESDWLPESTMTAEQVETSRLEFQAEFDAQDNAEGGAA